MTTDENLGAERDENAMGSIRFYGVVTLGNLLMVAASLVPVLIWGIRLESRVDTEEMLRVRLERQVMEQSTDVSKKNDRIEAMLNRITDDLTAVRIQIGGTPARPPKP